MCLGGWQGFEGTLLAVQSHAFGETCLTTPEEANSSAKVLKIHVEFSLGDWSACRSAATPGTILSPSSFLPYMVASEASFQKYLYNLKMQS